MARYATGSHTKHRLQYHLAWIPKYRKCVLQGKIAIRLKSLMYEVCKMNGWWISTMAIQDDHVHIVLQLPPRISVAEAAQIFKAGPCRVLRKEFPDMTEFLWEDSFWADGYFAETVGQINEEIILFKLSRIRFLRGLEEHRGRCHQHEKMPYPRPIVFRHLELRLGG